MSKFLSDFERCENMHKMEFISTGDILSYEEYMLHTVYKGER